jgi:hypothetical protein
MRADQVQQRPDGTVTVTFDTTPVMLPEPLDALVRRQLQTRGRAGIYRPDSFPTLSR